MMAEQNVKVIYKKFVKNNKTGNFDSFFIPTEDGTIRITAKLADENSTTAEGYDVHQIMFKRMLKVLEEYLEFYLDVSIDCS
jgi:hypothetical protein